MKDNTRAKGLGDLRTVTTHHIPSKPPRKGTTYLDLFALSMERQRLEQELAGIERRRKRIFDRLAEVQSSMEKLVNAAQQEKVAQSSSAEHATDEQVEGRPERGGRQWKKMPVEY
ncbi:MAG: hypothetical protein M1136_07550 [Chloroflexi bacterium]|nr:hypothetical protein [Chloroflexota bacterium]MCL5075489.1 hypothetical protein [Chloroflexota bacterium]